MLSTLIFILLSAQSHATQASDNLCLTNWKQAALAGLFDMPDVLSKETGLTDEQLRALPKQREEFVRQFVEDRNNVYDLEYNYLQTTGKYSIYHETSFKPLGGGANNIFAIVNVVTLAENGTPIYRMSITGGPKPDCSLSWNRLITYTLSPDPADVFGMIVSKKTVTGYETKEEQSKVARSVLQDTFFFDLANTEERLKAFSKRGHIENYNYDVGLICDITLKSGGPRRFYNPITNRIETSTNTAIGAAAWPDSPPTQFEYAKGESGFYLGTLKYSNATIDLELLTKNLWMKIEFPSRRQHYWAWTWGFRDSDLHRAPLVYTVDVPENYRYYSNYGAYYAITNPIRKNGNFTFDVVANDFKPPEPLPWLGTEKSGQGPYLDSTLNVDLKDVQEIADSMRPSLTGMNRLQVARAIIRKIAQLIHYDTEATDDGDVGTLNVKQILERKAGVCQHYAALFQGIARSLGIPARVIAGNALMRKEAGGHAWVEFMINDKTWWPLDPQTDQDTLPSLGYFPWGVDAYYQGHSQEEIDKMEEALTVPEKIYSFRRKDWIDSFAIDFKHSLGLDVLSRFEVFVDQFRQGN